MEIIRATKYSFNRIDAIFTGDRYLFFMSEFGLVAVAERTEINHDHTETKFSVERSMSIGRKVIEKTISDSERTFIDHKKIRFEYKNLEYTQLHALPYIPNIVLSKACR